jgi:hypothetical protein
MNAEDDMERRSATRIEQHIGTILQITVVALLGWSLATTQTMSQDVAVLKVRVEALSTLVNQGSNDRYRGTDAAKDFSSIRQEMQFMDRRIQALESRK